MFWHDLDPEDQLALREAGSRRHYRPGQPVFVEGEPSTHVVVVLEGRIKVARTSADGDEALIEIRGPGELLGEMGVVAGEPRSASLWAVSEVDALTVTADRFLRLIDEQQGLREAILRAFSDRLRQSAHRQLELSVGDAFARLCGRLAELAAGETPRDDGTVDVEVGLTQQELAEWIGVSREAVVIILRQLRQLGWVETGRKRIRILDLGSLQDAAIS